MCADHVIRAVVDVPAAPEPEAESGAPPPSRLADDRIGRPHLRRLREVYRSAGWPCCDPLELELLAAGLLARVRSGGGHETVRLTDAGVARLVMQTSANRAQRSRHEALAQNVARDMLRAGRLVWRELSLRARLPSTPDDDKARWCIARPDVFSIRNTSVEAYAQPIVHEVKVSRSDLLGDLRKPDKRAAYLDLGGECWYVLGRDARGRCIASPDEVPQGCGVLVLEGERLAVARPALHRPVQRLPFAVWLALAKAQPVAGFDELAQAPLGVADEEAVL